MGSATSRGSPTQIREQEISVMFLTTALFNQLAREVPWAFRSVRHLLFGGEAVDPKWVKEVLKHGPPKQLLHVYGPTESTTFTSWYLVQEVPEGATTIPIGRPISNTQIFLLDRHLNPVPIGVPGELYIGGDGLAHGYFNRPDPTAAMFIPTPFSPVLSPSTSLRIDSVEGDGQGGCLYKTGDLARFLPDGNIELLGRTDHQVKIRGFRIELGEIEAVLCQHPAIHQVIVLAREDLGKADGGGENSQSKIQSLKSAEKRLVAYVVPNQELVPTTSEPNGKVDRRALPAPDQNRLQQEETFVAPRDSLEFQLAKLWEKVLDINPIGVRDNFFDLGGHSLLAVQLLAQIEKVIGKHLPLATLFHEPTIEQLASILRQEGWSPPWSFLVPFQPSGSKPPFFCFHGTTALAGCVDSDQPFYFLQPHGLDGREVSCSVEDMAAEYIKEIRTLQPEGPYFLGGYSFGGMVVFEAAQQLRKNGQEVASLVLLDPTNPNNVKLSSPVAPTSPNRLRIIKRLTAASSEHMHKIARLNPREILDYVLGGIKWRINGIKNRAKLGIKNRAKLLVCKFYFHNGRSVPLNLRKFYFLEVSQKAARKYLPQVYGGYLTLLRSNGKARNGRTGWAELAAGGTEFHEMPGNHLDAIREPHAQVWSKRLGDCLEKAQKTMSGKRT